MDRRPPPRRTPSYYLPREKKKKKFPSASKLIIFSFVLTYFIGFAVATKIVLAEASLLLHYLGYIAAPVGVIIPFYINKSKAENTEGGVVYEAMLRGIDENSSSRG